MFTLEDGRKELWQWDTGRKLTVNGELSQVHFSNRPLGRSTDVDVVGGVAIIPDFLLQTNKDIHIWGYVRTDDGGYTKVGKTFGVHKRNKPSGYVFTETERITLESIIERVENAGSAIINTAEGKHITLTDSANSPVRNLKAYIPANTDGVSAIKLIVAGKNLAKADDKNLQYIIDPPVPSGTSVKLSFTATQDASTVDFYPYDVNGKGDGVRRKANVVKGERYSITVQLNIGDLRLLKMWSEYTKVTDVQVEIGGAATDYEPHNTETHTITLPEVSYGGYVDFVNGKYVQTHDASGVLETAVEHDMADLPKVFTRYPVTNLQTDCENLSVTYVADTKNYIDKKFNELATAMIANG